MGRGCTADCSLSQECHATILIDEFISMYPNAYADPRRSRIPHAPSVAQTKNSRWLTPVSTATLSSRRLARRLFVGSGNRVRELRDSCGKCLPGHCGLGDSELPDVRQLGKSLRPHLAGRARLEFERLSPRHRPGYDHCFPFWPLEG